MATFGIDGLVPASIATYFVAGTGQTYHTIPAGRFAIVYMIQRSTTGQTVVAGISGVIFDEDLMPLSGPNGANKSGQGAIVEEGQAITSGGSNGSSGILVIEYNKI